MFRHLCLALCVFAFMLVDTSFGQEENTRRFYAARRDGTGRGQWTRGDGYQATYEFFQVNPNEARYEQRVHYLVDSHPGRVFVYDETTGLFEGRWTCRGYSLLPKEQRKRYIQDILKTTFPKPDRYPKIPGAPDGMTRIPPPPTCQ